METTTREKNAGKTILWIVGAILLLLILIIGVFWLIHVLRVSTSPSIEIISPGENHTAPEFTPINIQAAAKKRITPVSQLDFYADGVLYGSISGTGYSISGNWTWTPSSSGTHDLTFVATNTKGLMNFATRTIEISPVADADGDGIPDAEDACPDEYGYPAEEGCVAEEDADADGLLGEADACPDIPGLSTDMGCLPDSRPDADGDGILDASDRCPDESGLPEFEGCPLTAWTVDRDGDGIPDLLDHCPDLAGTAESFGCPVIGVSDRDGDGVPDSTDACPDEPGISTSSGCPLVEEDDRDGDGIPDDADSCPDEPGVGAADGCLPEDWFADLDMDLIPDIFDRSPIIPGLFDLLGHPMPGDEDGDGVPDAEDRCPSLAGRAEDGGCPLLPLPADVYRIQNTFEPIPLPVREPPFEPEGLETRETEAQWPNDADRDGVEDSRDRCPEDGEPYLDGCPPTDDNDRDGIPNSIDRCDDIPGLYWGEYTDSYMLGCPKDPAGNLNVEVEITAIRINHEMKAAYCYATRSPSPDALADRLPPGKRIYTVFPVSGYGYYLKLSEYWPRVSKNFLESSSIELYITCWAQPDSISLPAVYLGEIVRLHTSEDWDSQTRYAAAINEGNLMEIYYSLCRDHCPGR